MKMTAIEKVLETVTGSPDVVSLDELVKLHIELDRLGKLANMVKKHIIGQLQAGAKVDGYKLVRTRGRPAYNDPTEVVNRLITYTGINPDAKLKELVSPISISSMRNALGADAVADLLGDLIVTNAEGKDFDYAPLDDERPAVN